MLDLSVARPHTIGDSFPILLPLQPPLTDLFRKNSTAKLVWTPECQHAFDTIRSALISTPILGYPLREGNYYVSMDASEEGIGAVLEQEQIVNGFKTRVVMPYASKTLSRSQRNYCATNKELLAVVWACEHFKYYILGRHFNIITDHASLVWLKRLKNPEGMVAR